MRRQFLKRLKFHRYSTIAENDIELQGPSEDPGWHRGTLWFDNIFPFKWPILDPRSYWIKKYAETYVQDSKWKSLVPDKFPEGSTFSFINAEPNLKEGGLFLDFKYKGGTVEEAVETIQKHVKNDNVRSIFNFGKVNAFQVKGRPWVEDLVSRIPSSRLHVEFYGPDLTKEALYREFRAFGRIVDITLQPSSSKDTPRFASVEFLRKRAATSAKNCIHGEKFGETLLEIGYEKTSRALHLWNWATSNLRISIPILLGILTALSFIIFDPWRVFSIRNKITNRFYFTSYLNYALETVGLGWIYISSLFLKQSRQVVRKEIEDWSERATIKDKFKSSLEQTPESLVLITGPKGSGKSDLLQDSLKDHPMKLIIKCDKLVGQLDHVLLSRFAEQVNFVPSFGAFSQISGMVDALITATTGAKAGLSSTKEGQISKILECLTIAVTELVQEQKDARYRATKALEQHAKHRGEPPQSLDYSKLPEVRYPVIVIEDYLDKVNSRGNYIYDILTQWASSMAEYKVAHVVFVSENPSAAKTIGKLLPTKSLEIFHLSDATPTSAIAYLRNRLGPRMTLEESKDAVDALGGRFHDLDLLIRKIVSGSSPKDAVQDMISRSIAELRKLGLQEDGAEEQGWTPIQFWHIMKLLTQHGEIPFDSVRIHALFKGDSSPILAMERAGLITLVHVNQRPHTIKPEKQLFKTAFKHIISDEKHSKIMDILTAKQIQLDEGKKIKDIEQELKDLSSIMYTFPGYFTSSHPSVNQRIKFLAGELQKYTSNYQKYAEVEVAAKAKLKFE